MVLNYEYFKNVAVLHLNSIKINLYNFNSCEFEVTTNLYFNNYS